MVVRMVVGFMFIIIVIIIILSLSRNVLKLAKTILHQQEKDQHQIKSQDFLEKLLNY